MSDPTEEEELRVWLDNETSNMNSDSLRQVNDYLRRAQVWGLTYSMLYLTRELHEEGFLSLLESFDTACTYWDI
jgi:hypothetical protein